MAKYADQNDLLETSNPRLVLALSEFLNGYSALQEVGNVPVTAWIEAKALLSECWYRLTSLMGICDPKAPKELVLAYSERPDPRTGLIRELSVGSLVAIGYLAPRSVSDRPVVIPSEYWLNANPNFSENTLSAAGFDFVHVQIVFRNHTGFPEIQHVNGWAARPLPELSVFGPSEHTRQDWGLPTVEASICDDQPSDESAQELSTKRKMGRPSLKNDILAAFDAIEKNAGWSEKQLADAVRQRVKEVTGKPNDNGLGFDAVMKHLRPLWQDFKKTPR